MHSRLWLLGLVPLLLGAGQPIDPRTLAWDSSGGPDIVAGYEVVQGWDGAEIGSTVSGLSVPLAARTGTAYAARVRALPVDPAVYDPSPWSTLAATWPDVLPQITSLNELGRTTAPLPGGAPVMSLAFIGYARNQAAPLGDVLSGATTLNIVAGDLLVGCANWNGSTGSTAGFNTGSGQNDFTMLTTTDGTDQHFAVGYKIAASANSTATARFTLSSERTYRSFTVLQFRPDSGDTVSLDVRATPKTGSTYLFSSNAIDPSGDDNAVVACFGLYIGRSIDPTFNIDDSAAGLPAGTGNYETHAGYRLFTSEKGSMDSDIELSGNSQYIFELLSFKSVAASVESVPVLMRHYAARRQ